MPAIQLAIVLASHTTIAVLLAIVACVVLAKSWRHIRETTLVGPRSWLVLSIVTLAAANVLVVIAEQSSEARPLSWKTSVLFAAAATSFCPLMSLLGAKRPQDRGWHFVVISLWAILVLPVAESLVLRHGAMPDVQGARSWFMLILIALGILNSLPTRLWFAGIIFGIGQVLMLADTLPFISDMIEEPAPGIGLALCATGAIFTPQLAVRRRRPTSLDSLWLDFRDSFGLLWALRLGEQVNMLTRSSKWPFTLRWRGFVDDDGLTLDASTLPEETRRALDQTLINLLRRFVSKDWIASRTKEAID